MIVQEILPLDWRPYADGIAVPDTERRFELDLRNSVGLARWYQREFGPVAGRVLCNEHMGKCRAL